uniref:Exosome protein n=1 Tax=Ignisphaera aggregans TaxID=334771 RepID=A0A7C2VG21_9CREN
MSGIEVSRVTIQTHSHATEDLDKVMQSILNILPPSLRNNITIERETLRGFYRNPIYRLKVVLGKDQALEFLKNLFKLMNESDKRILISSLDMRYNRKSNEMFIRLSKQDAYQGTVTLYEGDDAIKISIAFAYKRSLNSVRQIIEKLIEVAANDS